MANRGIITLTTTGDLKHVRGLFKRTKQKNFRKYLEYFGEKGCELLALETPVDTGKTAMSWSYEIIEEPGRISLIFNNSSTAGNTSIPVVLLIQYGHATKNGGYVAPYDFINPVTRELLQEMGDTIWKEVTSA